MLPTKIAVVSLILAVLKIIYNIKIYLTSV